jgi:hypothetical protein
MADVDEAPKGAADSEPSAKVAEAAPPKRGRGRPRKDAAKAASYVIAPGKAITTIRGILAEGAPITAADLSGGQDAFDALVKGGYVIAG